MSRLLFLVFAALSVGTAHSAARVSVFHDVVPEFDNSERSDDEGHCLLQTKTMVHRHQNSTASPRKLEAKKRTNEVPPHGLDQYVAPLMRLMELTATSGHRVMSARQSQEGEGPSTFLFVLLGVPVLIAFVLALCVFAPVGDDDDDDSPRHRERPPPEPIKAKESPNYAHSPPRSDSHQAHVGNPSPPRSDSLGSPSKADILCPSLVVGPEGGESVYLLPQIFSKATRKNIHADQVLRQDGTAVLGVVVKEHDPNPGILLHGPHTPSGLGKPLAFIDTSEMQRGGHLIINRPSADAPKGETWGSLEKLDRTGGHVVMRNQRTLMRLVGNIGSRHIQLHDGSGANQIGSLQPQGSSPQSRLELRLSPRVDGGLAILAVLGMIRAG